MDPSSSIPKRPCCGGAAPSAAMAAADLPDAVDRLLEAFLVLPFSSSSPSPSAPSPLDLALERIVDSRMCNMEKNRVVERAVRIGSMLLEAARRSERKLASQHNAAVWPLPPDLTVKVFSMLDTRSLCYAAATCSLFNKTTNDPLCYANIDLTMTSPKVNNAVVCTLIQRAGKSLRSLKLGACDQNPTLPQSFSSSTIAGMDDSMLSWNEKRSRLGKESSVLTRSCLLALSIDGGTAGALLKSLHLYNIDKMDNSALCAALSVCHSLVNLEVIGLHVELKQMLETVCVNCHLIESLFFESPTTGRDDSLKSDTCIDLVNACPNITSLALRGLKMHDHKARIFIKGLPKLKFLDFSTSYSITGSFLRVLIGGANGLEVLKLRDCLHLKEVEVSKFLSAVLAGECKPLNYLDISNRDGLSAEEDWYERCYHPCAIPISRIMEERPDICLVADFPTDRSFTEVDEIIDGELDSDFSLPLTPDSFFMTSSESSYNSDQGSGNDDVPEANFAFMVEVPQEATYHVV